MPKEIIAPKVHANETITRILKNQFKNGFAFGMIIGALIIFIATMIFMPDKKTKDYHGQRIYNNIV